MKKGYSFFFVLILFVCIYLTWVTTSTYWMGRQEVVTAPIDSTKIFTVDHMVRAWEIGYLDCFKQSKAKKFNYTQYKLDSVVFRSYFHTPQSKAKSSILLK